MEILNLIIYYMIMLIIEQFYVIGNMVTKKSGLIGFIVKKRLKKRKLNIKL